MKRWSILIAKTAREKEVRFVKTKRHSTLRVSLTCSFSKRFGPSIGPPHNARKYKGSSALQNWDTFSKMSSTIKIRISLLLGSLQTREWKRPLKIPCPVPVSCFRHITFFYQAQWLMPSLQEPANCWESQNAAEIEVNTFRELTIETLHIPLNLEDYLDMIDFRFLKVILGTCKRSSEYIWSCKFDQICNICMLQMLQMLQIVAESSRKLLID